MNIVFLTGSHPRHAAVARAIHRTGHLAGLVIEERSAFVPSPPTDLSDDLKALFVTHFQRREQAEARFFDCDQLPAVATLHVEREELNTPKVELFLKERQPDLLLSYGVHKLESNILQTSTGECWNIHGGLSPWYRGAITHFWPSYMLEPQMTGMTIHELTPQLDGGAIVHQNSAKLVRGDGLHDLACRSVSGLINELPAVIARLMTQSKLEKVVQKTTGKLWTGADWRPEHLRLIYEHFDDSIVDLALDKKIRGREPVLHRQIP